MFLFKMGSFCLKWLIRKTYTTNLIKTYRTYTKLPNAKRRGRP